MSVVFLRWAVENLLFFVVWSTEDFHWCHHHSWTPSLNLPIYHFNTCTVGCFVELDSNTQALHILALLPLWKLKRNESWDSLGRGGSTQWSLFEGAFEKGQHSHTAVTQSVFKCSHECCPFYQLLWLSAPPWFLSVTPASLVYLVLVLPAVLFISPSVRLSGLSHVLLFSSFEFLRAFQSLHLLFCLPVCLPANQSVCKPFIYIKLSSWPLLAFVKCLHFEPWNPQTTTVDVWNCVSVKASLQKTDWLSVESALNKLINKDWKALGIFTQNLTFVSFVLLLHLWFCVTVFSRNSLKMLERITTFFSARVICIQVTEINVNLSFAVFLSWYVITDSHCCVYALSCDWRV